MKKILELIILERKLNTLLAGLLLLLFVQISPAQQKSSRDIVSGELGAKINSRTLELEAKGFSGVLFISKDGQTLISKGYGLANREKQIPYSPETVFDIGSITKQFTAAAILKLEMQGKLSTSDKITKYFQEVPPDKADITLHHLLTHSAGLVGNVGASDYKKMSRDEIIKLTLNSKLLSAPGEKYKYSNVGYSLLGAIIEIVTGKPYEHYLHDNLFKPAGIKQTGYVIPKWKPENLAVGYKNDGSAWGTPLDHPWDKDGPYWNLRANGGILSTVGDLYKWHVALEGEKILSKAAKEKYFAPHIAENPEGSSFYGYGWAIEKTSRNTKRISHNGSNGYFFADFLRFVDENVVVIVATNTRNREVLREGENILSLVFTANPTSRKQPK